MLDRRLFAIGFAWTMAQLPLGLHRLGFGPVFELWNVARSIARHGTFSDPFGAPTGPTAHVAPVYPSIAAAIILLFQQPTGIILAVSILNAAFTGLTAALMPAISRRVFSSPVPGIAGGLLTISATQLSPEWDASFSALLLGVATLAILSYRSTVAGAWSGLSLLSNPASLPALVVLNFRRSRFLVLLIALAVCAPWLVRNWIVMGTPYFIRDSLGLELWLSNSDRSRPEMEVNPPVDDVHPTRNPAEKQLVRELGEGPYNARKMATAREWIETHPRRFLQLTVARVFYYWFPSPREGWPAYLYCVITVLGALGVIVARPNSTAVRLAVSAVAYSVTFALTATDLRHRLPSLWMTGLLAGFGGWRLALAFQALPRVRTLRPPGT